METEWSIEAGADDPVIVVPWADISAGSSSDAEQRIGFVDLRANPVSIDRIVEAVAWPEMCEALLILNAADSQVLTAKCDAWVLGEEEKELDFGPVPFGVGAYVDVFVREREIFASLAAMRSLVELWADLGRNLTPEDARAEFVIRPAYWNDEAGYAVTVYVFGYGEHEARARSNWADGLNSVVRLVAGRLERDEKRYNVSVGE